MMNKRRPVLAMGGSILSIPGLREVAGSHIVGLGKKPNPFDPKVKEDFEPEMDDGVRGPLVPMFPS